MTELHLNGLPAVLPQNLNIKVNHENVYLTAASQYTLDIELPLQGCPQNLAIFGHINRIDARRRSITLQALLTASGKVILKGSALITSITRRSVKVQLLAGNSEFNFFGKGEGMYINEMDLSKYHPATFGETVTDKKEWANCISRWSSLYFGAMRFYPVTDLYKPYPEANFVCYPTIFEDYENAQVNAPLLLTLEGEISFNLAYEGVGNSSTLSMQPYLCWLIEIFVKEMGYKLVANDMTKSTLKNIFVCLAGNSINFAELLPHWTVNEFFRQVEQLLGMTLVVDEVTHTARMVSRKDFFKGNTLFLDNVVDDFEVEVDEEVEKDVSNGRIGYADNGYEGRFFLPEDVISNCTVKNMSTKEELFNHIDTDAASSRIIYEWSGKRYIHYTANDYTWPLLVDQARPRPAADETDDDRKKELDVTLKMVPARLKEGSIEWYSYVNNKLTQGVIPFPMLSASGATAIYDFNTVSADTTIQQLLDGEVEAATNDSSKDVMEIAWGNAYVASIINPKNQTEHSVYYYPVTFEDNSFTALPSGELEFSMELNQSSHPTIGTLCHSGLLQIDKTAKRCIRFLHPGSVDPKQLFVIRGKRFVCEKIERQIDSKGMQPLVTGYFYEVSE